ncbi:MAG: sugar-binding protein [Schleiferiaceae bacterium]|nr:sugar-binding protein [Schleiferiaceae bacterium]
MRKGLTAILGLIVVSACSLKPAQLYDYTNPENTYPNIKGFASLIVLNGPTGDEFWVSKEAANCIKYAVNEAGIYSFTWNKPGGGCDWVGMGVGWDQWAGKNMGAIVDEAAMRLTVRLPKGAQAMKTLPLAFGFEDYSGRQAWIGMSSNYVVNGPITQEWTNIDLPLGLFNWNEMDCDPTNIKQFVAQFEADGEFELKEMRVVPFSGSLRKQAKVGYHAVKGRGRSQSLIQFPDGSDLQLSWDSDSLYLDARITDRNELVNSQTGVDLWNGDALELAFSAQPEMTRRPRTNFLFSDVHLGLSLGETPEVVNFRTGETIPNLRQITILEGGYGYNLRWALPWEALNRAPWTIEGRYLFEVARDQGDANGRTQQIRWNSGEAEGFHLNPGLWGELLVEHPREAEELETETL